MFFESDTFPFSFMLETCVCTFWFLEKKIFFQRALWFGVFFISFFKWKILLIILKIKICILKLMYMTKTSSSSSNSLNSGKFSVIKMTPFHIFEQFHSSKFSLLGLLSKIGFDSVYIFTQNHEDRYFGIDYFYLYHPSSICCR